MTLPAGTKLGPYEILAPLGAGGMGEVYKALDARLDRTVAIKVLPTHLASSPDARQRFEREAKTISQFSHPHICALYDVGREGETEYLVMEYLEGETLSDRLARGPLALDQTLRYGSEMADALDKAHRRGIVHRDLKPGNVMLTKTGVKLLDFGLAKGLAPASAAHSLTALPTQANLTQEGTILGTLQYMAPEQLEGKEADARTDIFALGAVLYEMATGRKAFPAGSQASLITAIMSSEPVPISAVQPTSPATLDRVVRTCLAKDPEDRWQSAHDIGRELQWIREGSGAAGAVRVPRRARRARIAWTTAAVAVATVLVALAAFAWSRRTPAPEAAVLTMLPPAGLQFGGGIALSPDGRTLAFLAAADGRDAIWVRRLDEAQARKLGDTDGARCPFWSPDGRTLGFFQDNKLRRIDADGGTVQTICVSNSGFGGAWSPSGTILFAPAFGEGLSTVSAAGGEPRAATTLDVARGDATHFFPVFLPDGHHFLFVVRNVDAEKTAIYAGDLESKTTKLLCRSDSAPVWSPLGYLLVAREGTLFAQKLDPRRLELVGEPVPVVRDVRFFTDTNAALWSAGGSTLVYGLWPHDRRLVWLDRKGAAVGTLGPVADYNDVAVSPDGRRVAASRRDAAHGQNLDVWVLDAERGTGSRVTSERSDEFHSVWTRDGASLYYTSDRAGPYDIYRRPAAGGAEEIMLRTKWDKVVADALPDGTFLFVGAPSQKDEDLWTLSPASGAEPVRVVGSDHFTETEARYSPDGRWIAFTSNESGRADVYVAPAAGGPKQLASSGVGHNPVWRRDGRELYYLDDDGRLLALSVTPSASGLVLGQPQPLFELKSATANAFSPQIYDVAPDGRFVVVRQASDEAPGLVVSLHWTQLLKK